jgi:hypothetical protein
MAGTFIKTKKCKILNMITAVWISSAHSIIRVS